MEKNLHNVLENESGILQVDRNDIAIELEKQGEELAENERLVSQDGSGILGVSENDIAIELKKHNEELSEREKQIVESERLMAHREKKLARCNNKLKKRESRLGQLIDSLHTVSSDGCHDNMRSSSSCIGDPSEYAGFESRYHNRYSLQDARFTGARQFTSQDVRQDALNPFAREWVPQR